MSFLSLLPGSVIMAPMTKGSNLPYRRLCAELGAQVLVSEMVVARRLKQRRRGEWALLRRAPNEPCFGIQLAGNQPDEMAWAAALAESRGADFVDVNLGCPIDHFTRKGLGAALARQPKRVHRIVEAMRQAVRVPVTVKIRLGWTSDQRNYLEVARAAVDAGASALTVHGRTREARYRHPADWETISEIAASVPVPVIGNGDLLFAHEVHERLRSTGCVAVMSARGVLIKPWLFREISEGYRDITAEERLAIYRRYVEFALEHWQHRPRLHDAAETSESVNAEPSEPTEPTEPVNLEPVNPEPVVSIDEYGRERVRDFLRWHVGFWVRYAPQRPDGTWPSMQQRESTFVPRSPLEALFARTDDAAVDYITDRLIARSDLDDPPPRSAAASEPVIAEAG